MLRLAVKLLKAKYGLNPVPDLDQEPDPEPEPKLFHGRNQNHNRDKSYGSTTLLKETWTAVLMTQIFFHRMPIIILANFSSSRIEEH